jgi:Flp pilus assembly protein TadD
MAAAVLAVFASSFWYRMQHPSLQVAAKAERAPEVQGPPGGMQRIQELMAAVREDPKNVPALLELSQAFLMMRAFDRALAFLDQGLAVEPRNAELLRARGAALFRKQDFAAAAGVFSELKARDQNDAVARFNLGVLYKFYLDRRAEGEAELRAVLALGHGDEELNQMARRAIEGE